MMYLFHLGGSKCFSDAGLLWENVCILFTLPHLRLPVSVMLTQLHIPVSKTFICRHVHVKYQTLASALNSHISTSLYKMINKLAFVAPE